MPEMIAYCGLMCRTCPIYLATRQENGDERARMKAEIVRLCKEHYGIQYAIEDITDCDGCTSESNKLFSSSMNCRIRQCAREKRLENCAHCAEYACEKLKGFFQKDPGAKERLDVVRNSLL